MTYKTKKGKVITPEELNSWVEEAERGYDVAQLRNIAAHTNRFKNSRTRNKREARKQEARDEG